MVHRRSKRMVQCYSTGDGNVSSHERAHCRHLANTIELGLTKAADRKRIDSVLDRARRHGYCPLDLPLFDKLCKIADDELFGRAMRLSSHVLHALIPP